MAEVPHLVLSMMKDSREVHSMENSLCSSPRTRTYLPSCYAGLQSQHLCQQQPLHAQPHLRTACPEAHRTVSRTSGSLWEVNQGHSPLINGQLTPYFKFMLEGTREMTTYSRRLFLPLSFPVPDLGSSPAPLCSLTAAIVLHNHRAQNKHKNDSKSKLHFQEHALPSFWTSLFSTVCRGSLPLSPGYGLAQCACNCQKRLVLVATRYQQDATAFSITSQYVQNHTSTTG